MDVSTVRRATAHGFAGALIALAVMLRVDPESKYYPPCPIYTLLHLRCPGCGGTRAVAALMRGNLAEALQWNALVVIAMPLALVYAAKVYGHMVRKADFEWPEVQSAAAYGLLGVTVFFALVRDLWGF